MDRQYHSLLVPENSQRRFGVCRGGRCYDAKRPAFDAERLATALAEACKQKVDSRKLSFQAISFVDDEKEIQFDVENIRWKCDLSSYAVARAGTAERRGFEAGRDPMSVWVRGTGGLGVTSFGEENLLSLPLDRYDDESIAVHEFCHTIDAALRTIDPTWNHRKNALYKKAQELQCHSDIYAGLNAGEYWTEIDQAYFDCSRVNNWNHGPVGNRERLQALDPEGYEWVYATFNLGPGQDWRYAWLEKLPNVTAPPARFGIDPYYTKFTWAREFTILGRQAQDEALLRAGGRWPFPIARSPSPNIRTGHQPRGAVCKRMGSSSCLFAC